MVQPARPSSLQLQVTPRETEVFVDGYFAGRVDDFDGRFQRLPIPRLLLHPLRKVMPRASRDTARSQFVSSLRTPRS
jgi:hypothetical protein